MTVRDPLPNDADETVVYDFDTIPAERRREVVSRVAANKPSHRTAIHTFDPLPPNEEKTLLHRDVMFFRRLEEIHPFLNGKRKTET